MANFAPKAPVLEIASATATRTHGRIDVTVVVRNSGDADAQAVMIGTKKEATVDGRATHVPAPILLGNIVPGDLATTALTFTGAKAGTQTLQVTLTYTGGTATLSTQVTVP